MFGEKYNRQKFWTIYLITLVAIGILNGMAPLITLVGSIVLLNTLANSMRDYGSHPWFAVFGPIRLVGLVQVVYFGIAEAKGAKNTLDSNAQSVNSTASEPLISSDIEDKPNPTSFGEAMSKNRDDRKLEALAKAGVTEDEVQNFSSSSADDQNKILSSLTKSCDWLKVQQLQSLDTANNYLVKKELSVLGEYLEEDEIVYAFGAGVMSQQENSNITDFGLNTLLFVLTNMRIVILDHAILTKSVDVNSIWLSSVKGFSSSQGLMLGKITVDTGGFPVVFDNCLKNDVKKITSIANKILREMNKPKMEEQASTGKVSANELREMHELLQSGVITQEEFENFKKKALG